MCRPVGKLLAQLILHHEGKRLVEVGLGEKHFAGALGRHRNTRHGKIDTARRQQARQRGQIFHLDEFDLDTKVASEKLGHLHVEPDQRAVLVAEDVRQPVGEHAHAQGAARPHGIQHRPFLPRRFRGLRHRQLASVHGPECRLHPIDDFRSTEFLAHDRRERRPQPDDDAGRQQHGDQHEPPDANGVELDAARDGGAAEQRDRDRVHRGQQRAEPRVDDAGREEQLEGVGRDAERVEQERHRRVQAAEERQEAGEREPRIVASRGTAASANQPANRMKLSDSSLPVCGKLNDAGTITSGSAVVCSSVSPCRCEQVLARLDQDRQDDEQVAGHEGGDQRVTRRAQHLAVAESASAPTRAPAAPTAPRAARRAT